jgi:enoyl-[acyl-carrier protein] reductase I
LITGVLSNRSIAYGIAKACHAQGAELAFSYVGERFKERITEFAADFGSKLIFDCDVGDDAQIEAVHRPVRHLAEVRRLRAQHRLRPARGDRRRLPRRPVARGLQDRARHQRLQLPGHGQGGPALPERKSALLTLTYLGAMRTVPNYNTMGLAKAVLEASVRYLAESLGPKGMRVNGISAGPIKTLAASGIKGFGKILSVVAEASPRRSAAT